MNWRDKWREIPAWMMVGILMLFALGIRFLYLWGHPMESRDGIIYILFTERWFREGAAALPEFLQIKPLLYCYLARSLMYLGISASVATLAVNLAAGTLLLIPVYLIGRVLFREKAAAYGLCAFAAMMPPLIRFSCERLREGVYLFWFAWALCGWVYAIRKVRPLTGALLTGIAIGGASYCRFEAMELLAVAAVTLPLSALGRQWNWRLALNVTGCFVLGVSLTMVLLGLLPGMPNHIAIYYYRIMLACFGTRFNPV